MNNTKITISAETFMREDGSTLKFRKQFTPFNLILLNIMLKVVNFNAGTKPKHINFGM